MVGLHKKFSISNSHTSCVNIEHLAVDLLNLLEYSSVSFYTNSTPTPKTHNLQFNEKFYFLYILLLRGEINAAYYTLIDVGGFFSTRGYTLVTTLANLLHHMRFSCFLTQKLLVPQISTISTLYPGSLWVERELRELDYLVVRGLVDSRKLLQDYT